MAEPIPLYNGATPKQAQQRFANIPGIDHIADSAADKLQRAVIETGQKIVSWHDFGVKQEADVKRNELDIRQEQELNRIFNLSNGAEGSFWDADGKLNEDNLNAFANKWVEQYNQIPGNYWSAQAIKRDNELRASETNRLKHLIYSKAAGEENRRRRHAYETNLTLATERENWNQAAAIINSAYNAGQISEAERDLSQLRLGRTRLKADSSKSLEGYPVSVNIGGTEYSGLSAALAMDEARQASTSPQDSPASKSAETEQTTAYNYKPVLASMSESELGEISDAFAYDYKITAHPNTNGKTEVHAAAHAPECVQRVAAHGTAHGGIDADQAKMMIARISLDLAADNPSISTEQAMKVFDSAGLYETLGAGDAAVGKARSQAIVSECIDRGTGNTDKLAMASLDSLITARLNSEEFAASREWGKIARLNPGLQEGSDWDKSDLEGETRQKWFALYDVYKKYRHEFNPAAEGKLDKDEFEENAQAFHNWYMKKKYPALKKADEAAARDWYTMRAASELRNKAYADQNGQIVYQGYGNDLQIARAVLRESPPTSLGAEELLAATHAEQENLRSTEFRKAAKADYEKLHTMKQSYAENSEKAKQSKERLARARERQEEKEAREAEKKAEKLAARKLAVARATPRQSLWQWDGKNAPDGAYPTCLLPENEARHLVEELGYDGSQDVYLQLNGVRVQIIGISKSGKIELNSTAVAKIQKRPNRKKGETWKTGGELGYSYHFKTSEAK